MQRLLVLLFYQSERVYAEVAGITDVFFSLQSAVVQELGGLSGNVSAAVELMLCQGHDPQQPLFNTLPPAVYGKVSPTKLMISINFIQWAGLFHLGNILLTLLFVRLFLL